MKNKTALVIGCNGQDGSLICKSLLDKSYKVIGISRSGVDKTENLKSLNIDKDVIKEKSDICDFKKMSKHIELYTPDEIYNLAAQSSVGKSFAYPKETIEGIINGTINLLEISRITNFQGRIFFAGSSEIFGNTEVGADINYRQQPINPYAIGKQTSFNLVKLYRETYNLKCVTGILFNHESNLRQDTFVSKKIINSAKKIAKGEISKIKLGNINVIRDWGWAPEYVEAIQLITNAQKLQDHVICTGEANTLERFIEIVFQCCGLNWREHVEIDHELFRENEIQKSFGNPKQIFNQLGWKASTKLKEVVEKMLNY